jgi:hypothetical protein
VLRQLTNKFLHRVRIHGGEFDSSARAMNRAEQGDLFQAELRKFRGSTFERKQMSTTIKRVALVAVAALTLGVVSVAPSTAAINQDSLTLSAATAAQTTAETATATSATVTLSFLGSAGDSASVTAALVSGPAGNTALPYLALVETASATINENVSAAPGDLTAPNTAVRVGARSGSAVTTAKFAVFLGVVPVSGLPTAPVKAGTYVVKITPASLGASGALLGSTAQTLTITVTAAPALDTVASSATIILNKGETSSATTDATVTFPKDLQTNEAAAATITVKLLNAAGSTTTGESYTAVITGPGFIGSGANSGTTISGPTKTGRALTVKASDVVQIFPDGSSGVATVTISSAAGKVLGSKSITFYGDAASITASTTALTTGTIAKVGSNTGLISFKVADAAGTAVTTGTFYLVSADKTIISNSYTACSAYDSTNGFRCDLTGVAKGTTTVYVTNRSSATDTTAEVKSNAVSVRVGSTTAASVSITTDKSSYAPGEKATISVVIKDADGNLVPSGDYNNILKAGGITASYTLGAGSDTTTVTNFAGAWATVDGEYDYTVYMPVTEGDVKFSWTTGTGLATANQGVAGSVTVNVTSAATSAAIDAANEAAQAASDATDAALAAADAADAATTKAQEAVDAVATLSAQVSKLITALKAQITTLTNLVIKIQKKVKA